MATEIKEGSFIGLLEEYIESKGFDKSIIKSVEPKRLVLGKGDKEVSIQEKDVCKMVLSFNDTNDIEPSASIRNIPGSTRFKKLRLITRKESLDLGMSMGIESREGTYGSSIYVGDGNLDINFRNYLTKFPELTESFDIECTCDNINLRCKGKKQSF